MFIAFLNLFNLFESSVYFSFRVDDFYHEKDMNSVELIIMINSHVICIAVDVHSIQNVTTIIKISYERE